MISFESQERIADVVLTALRSNALFTDRHSAGSFSRVEFIYTRGDLHTYRYRVHNVEPKGTQVNVLFGSDPLGPPFTRLYERMSE